MCDFVAVFDFCIIYVYNQNTPFLHDCALFIRRIYNFSQVILKYTITMSHNKFILLESKSNFGPGDWSQSRESRFLRVGLGVWSSTFSNPGVGGSERSPTIKTRTLLPCL